MGEGRIVVAGHIRLHVVHHLLEPIEHRGLEVIGIIRPRHVPIGITREGQLVHGITGGAGSFADYLEAKVLDHVFGKTTFTAAATLYAAAYTATPGDTGGGTEATGGSYARVAVTNNTTNFTNATGTAPTSKTTGTDITFPTATADWGTISASAFWDDPTAGNLYAWGTLQTNKIIGTGDTYKILAGGATITLD